jgi:hypothetical protein
MRAKFVKDLFPLEIEFGKSGPRFEKEFLSFFRRDNTKAMKKLDAYEAAAFAKVIRATEKLTAAPPAK